MNDTCSVGRARTPLHVALACWLLTSVAAAGESDVAPVDSADVLDDDAIGDERRAHHESVQGARASDDPFQPSGVWLPPFYLADAERSIEWIGLLYLDLCDFEEGTRARLLPPLFLWLGGPQDRTLVTPFFGGRRDAQGEAGYAGAYVWRRDLLADTDIVLPFYWSFRERDVEDGDDARSFGAVAPFVYWNERASGDHWTIAPPLFWRWGDARETTTIAAPFASSHERGDDHTLLIPPLLTYHEQEAERSLTVVANTYISLRPLGWSFAFAPLVFADSSPGGTSVVGFPLLWHFTDETRGTTVVGPFFNRRAPEATHTGFAPLWFSGRYADGSAYDIGAPLFWRFEDAEGERLLVLPLLDYARDATGTRVLSPFMYHRADADHVEGASSKTIVLGLYWDLRGPELHARVAFPLWWQFEDLTTGTALSTFFPLFWRYDREDETTCVLLNSAWSSGTTEHGPTWSFHLFPLVDVGSDAPDHLRWQVLGGLLGRESRGERSRWRLAFTWLDPS